ncbi:hypothetical protein J31TS4_23470 [Paenibacillus sp. J31TS4]|uniref:DUF445 domain-containing protein n=1 Tax=Paenibacillus sp. J31TS4 TaxID=2807195 RepID=UPI001AFE219E|nr:DUF445 domain-containing protein [Paenibacillus sp. J31TS4]GIP39067.1 hypothetical protein J31TS4_23470 [Paenibacillus sp. J31TS4]
MKTRYMASASLAVMGAGFLATLLLPDNKWSDLLHGGFEAGLVGGIADWFAVTALFRHPLGLKIPHTSLLLKNRDKIVASLISAMEEELLNKKSITEKLSRLRPLQSAGTFGRKLLRQRRMRESMLEFAEALVRRIPLEELTAQLQKALAGYARNKELRPLAERAAGFVRSEGWDERAFDYVLEQGTNWVLQPDTRQMLGQMAHAQLSQSHFGGIMGFAVQAFAGFMKEDQLGTTLQQLIYSALQELTIPGNQNRERLLLEIRSRLQQLAQDEALLARGHAWLVAKAESPETSAMLGRQLEALRDRLLEALERERQAGGKRVFRAYRYVVRKLTGEPELVEDWNGRIVAAMVKLVEQNHYRIGLLVKDNLDKLDDATLVAMLEEKVGGDLQWIRVNGAICGFLIGLVLTVIGWMG